MTPGYLFSVANLVAMGGWGLLIFLPDNKYTNKIVRSGYLSLGLAALYTYSIFAFSNRFPFGAGFGSIPEVRALFSSDWGLLAGWVHYLAFDLVIGVQVDSMMRSRGNLWRIPALLFTFLLGPIGWGFAKVVSLAKNKGR